jgi:hypothetical protein
MDYADYCRQLETYLCQKNGGHLIRIVGPAFEQVCGWAERGIPLTVACRGIDRFCERRQAKNGSRARPVRIEFCEPDILDVFEEWRRAVGITLTGSGPEPSAQVETQRPTQGKKPALAAHFERVVARLVARHAPRSAAFEQYLERLLSELDRLSADAGHARGEARATIVERLAALDRELIEAATAEVEPDAAARAQQEAAAEIAPFGSRMAPDVRARALHAAYERLIRESLGLPTLRYG